MKKLKDIISMGATNIIGVNLIGATAQTVGELPVGTAKTIAGNIPTFQSVALVSENVKAFKKQNSTNKKKNKLW